MPHSSGRNGGGKAFTDDRALLADARERSSRSYQDACANLPPPCSLLVLRAVRVELFLRGPSEDMFRASEEQEAVMARICALDKGSKGIALRLHTAQEITGVVEGLRAQLCDYPLPLCTVEKGKVSGRIIIARQELENLIDGEQ
ncbi:hypothetical protein CYMTET_26394 [Cymbomonas tetramitiformis]|uniref:Uncharacterized protein n=1 Tax=Cymbomonas tetramitiformis TaxID=36881 RepID=A0AAE0FRS9_9CHLO|nr:hypothetical protein CYMTET_26394 [Cymbomonas tetramitiformis]|eukprot:gene21787-26207_t